MQRRTKAMSGCVNFPVDDQAWINSNQGGMVVKLVVCDNREFDKQFSVCCGGAVFDLLGETLTGDDRRQKPKTADRYDSVESVQAEEVALAKWEAYHFPNANDLRVDDAERYISREYLAAIVLGTTGWSGWNEIEGSNWACRFDDLSEEGKALYKQIENLYSGCDLHLLTYLDT